VFEKKVEKRVTEAVAVAVDTLQQGQDQANAKADTAFKVAKALGKQVNENTNDLIVTKSRTRKVEAKADRALNSVTSPGKVNAKQIPSLSTSPRMNGKKVSQNEGEYTSDELATHY
jgi:Flp pilus assembly protein TadG